MKSIVSRLMLTAEDLAKTNGYAGYVRMLVEAAAEIEHLRDTIKRMRDTTRTMNKQKGVQRGARPRIEG